MKTISVIIPMYNAEAYIMQSIQSVLNQTYCDFEILIIDDGSTDRGVEICRELGNRDSRIHLHCREKKGVSAARNHGLDVAEGKYVFFLDSDDAIHPQLFEEMVYQMEKHRAGFAFCYFECVDSQRIDTILDKVSYKDEHAVWLMEKEAETEERFHTNDAGIMTRIGGKMIRKDVVGKLRFNEALINGEDTLFIYQLLCKQMRSVFSFQEWYYYRIHAKSVSHSVATIKGKRYFEYVRKIRDGEYQRGHSDYALNWEVRVANKMEKSYLELKRAKDKQGCKWVKQIEKIERKHPLYPRLPLYDRLLFYSCFRCRFIFHVVRRMMYIYRLLEKRLMPNRRKEPFFIKN